MSDDYHVDKAYRVDLRGATRLTFYEKIPHDRIGDLIVAFNKAFPTFSLVPHFFCETERRKEVELVVIKSIQHYANSASEFDFPSKEEHKRMAAFVNGFAAGCKKV